MEFIEFEMMKMIMVLPRSSKSSIGKPINKGSNCGSFISWASKGHGGEGEQSLK